MFDIITDVEKGISALIDPTNGRALGPILQSAEHGVQLLETFVGGINRDPAELHPSDLERLFREFIAAIAEPEPAGSPEAAAANGEQPPAAGIPEVTPAEASAVPAPAETALPGQTGAVAGPTGGSEQAAPAGGVQVDTAHAGLVADGGLPTGIEQAAGPGEAPAPSPEQQAREAGGAQQVPAGEQGGGVPKA